MTRWFWEIQKRFKIVPPREKRGRRIRVPISDAAILEGKDVEILKDAIKDVKAKSVFITKHYEEAWILDLEFYD